MNISRRGALALPVLFAPAIARAQEEWPSRPIRIVVPFAAGGSTDIVARLLATHLAPRLGRPVVVDNRAGATTTIGAAEVARAAPDGYTFLLAPPPFAIVQYAFPSLPYDPEKDFRPVSQVMSSPFVFAVRSELPAQTLAEVIALAKARPGALTYATPGAGSLPHVATEIFRLRTGTDILHVPYRGGGPAVIDMAGGRVDMYFGTPPETVAQVQAGRVRVLAVASAQPSELVPGVPTVASTVPGMRIEYWTGVMAPAGTPDAIVNRMHAEIQAVLAMPEMRQRLFELGGIPVPGSIADFAAFLDSERAQYREAVAAANIRVQ